jgi:hypothetical protein
MFKVSHEVPLCLLEKSKSFNDYDYALIHLFQKYPSYRDFFKSSLKEGREVLLDNSAYELGDSFDIEKFYEEVNSLKPSYYIIPDQLGNFKKTIGNYREWEKIKKDVEGKSIAVIQGASKEEWLECFEILNNSSVDKLAVSFGLSWYKDADGYNLLQDLSLNHRKALGRFSIVLNIKDKIKKPLHLLGSYFFQEFRWYNDSSLFPFIDSIDTSLPVKAGYVGEHLEISYDSKPSILIDEIIGKDLTEEEKKLILDNISFFRKFSSKEKV